MQFWRVYDKKLRAYTGPCFESKEAATLWVNGFNSHYKAQCEVEGPCYLCDVQWSIDFLSTIGIKHE